MAGFARATGMRSGRPLANDAHDKQWYTLVKLDEYGGVGHVVSDRELQELEDLILSGEDPSDDSSFNDGQTLSGTSRARTTPWTARSRTARTRGR